MLGCSSGLESYSEGPQNCKQHLLQPAVEGSQREQKIPLVLDGSSARVVFSEEQVCECRMSMVVKFTREVNWMDSCRRAGLKQAPVP